VAAKLQSVKRININAMRGLITIGLTILLLAMISCKSSNSITEMNGEEKIFWVNSSKKPCTGVAPMHCLEVQEGSSIEENEWSLFYSAIEGFEYQPGDIYRIKVWVEKQPEPIPADASSLKYKLVEILEQFPDKKLRLSNIWAVELLEEIERPRASEKSLTLEINVSERRYFAFSGCNTLRGFVSPEDENKIVFGYGASTMMACDPDIMQLERQFSIAIKDIRHYSFNENRLVLMDSTGKSRIVLKNVD
jgi:heat shock protein HslJ